jgi:sulfatase maturation enzyme AslB (radical SAM superfamily)
MFRVIFRHEAMQRTFEQAPYTTCRALPFWSYVDSGGNVWGCLRHIGEAVFNYGNLLKIPFAQLLAARKTPTDFSIADCHTDCRMEPINNYLWELTHPGAHVNFI